MAISFLTQLALPNSSKEDSESPGDSDADVAHTSRTNHVIEMRLADRRKTQVFGNPSLRCIRFPKKSKEGSVKPLAQMFKVLDLAHEAILSGVPATKRDIFYRDVPLFKSQKVVDRLVDDLSATFGLERSDLNIRSSSKGLVCGACLTISLVTGETIVGNDTEGALIPAGEDIDSFAIDESIAWVLVVEKEAVFQTLCRLQITKHTSMPGPGILITGKGYPDVATRHIIKSLADALPKRQGIPILIFVDGDPYGLDILSVYKYGSKSMQHESEKLAARRVKWIGLWASELEQFNIDKEHLLPITKHDEKKAISMLRRNDVPLPRRWKKELQHMLHNRHKAEIEILSSSQSGKRNTSECILNSGTAPVSQYTDWHDSSDLKQPAFVHDGFGLPYPPPPPFEGSASILVSSTVSHSMSNTSLSDCSVLLSDTKHNPHALLMRYLGVKIASCVASAKPDIISHTG
ncbi:Spo11/DNA topoisomerase VI subunit A [Crassisporium funariophilum]|nr:Spo11/DNA topoisomerase VI subunit A [Crassisporium funariophilum]